MINRKLFISLFSILALQLNAQKDSTVIKDDIHLKKGNFVFTHTKLIIESNRIDFVPGQKLFSAPVFQLDTTQLELGYVKFFQRGNMFFANIDKVSGLNPSIRLHIMDARFKTDRFALRTHHGNANLFYYQATNYAPSFSSSITGNSRGVKVRNRHFFNKGTDDLIKLNYVNAKRELSSSLESKRQLKRYVNFNIAAVGVLGLTVPYFFLWERLLPSGPTAGNTIVGFTGALGLVAIIGGSIYLFYSAKESLKKSVLVF